MSYIVSRSNEVFPNRYRAIIEALNSSDILILDVTLLKKEDEAAVKKKYSVANPVSFVGPTEADIHRNALFEKLLMESGVYESAEEIAKREEILLRVEQVNTMCLSVLEAVGELGEDKAVTDKSVKMSEFYEGLESSGSEEVLQLC
ncbi:nuclear poly(A) polymerase 4-like protein [Tanacetum coccineum]